MLRMEKQEFLRNIKKEYLEGKIEKKELGYIIMQRLGISQGPAYALRKKDHIENRERYFIVIVL
jgi:hypothetical protein